MILDATLMMSENQAITSGTVVSTNTIDFGKRGTVPPRGNGIRADMGFGTKIPLLVQVTQAFAGLTSLSVSLQTSDTEDFAEAKTVFTEEIKADDLKEGCRISLPVVPYKTTGRYIRMSYEAAGTATAGAVTACITWGNEENLPYL